MDIDDSFIDSMGSISEGNLLVGINQQNQEDNIDDLVGSVGTDDLDPDLMTEDIEDLDTMEIPIEVHLDKARVNMMIQDASMRPKLRPSALLKAPAEKSNSSESSDSDTKGDEERHRDSSIDLTDLQGKLCCLKFFVSFSAF